MSIPNTTGQNSLDIGKPKMIRRKNGFIYELRKNKILFLMVLPTLIFFLIFCYFPLIGLYFAFTKFNFTDGLFGSPFVGFENFEFLTHSGILLRLTLNTIGYNFVFIIVGNLLAIVIAILLSEMKGKYYKKTLQSVMLLPYFVSYVLISSIAYNLFNVDNGFLNTLLNSLHLEPIDIYNTPGIWPFLIILFYLWKGLGYSTVIYLATIVGINSEYYEAADIDGANIFHKIRFITLPMLKPTFIILLLFALGNILKGQFELFYQLVGNNGLLFNATDIIETYVYRSLKVNFDVGMATAAGLYQSVFGFALIMTVNYVIRKINNDYALF